MDAIAQGRDIHRTTLAAGAALRGRSTIACPRLALGPCVRAYMTRDTLGLDLAEADRLNHFPASPACAITWFLQGEADWVAWADDHEADPGCARRPIAGRVIFTGPQTRPTVFHNPGEVRCFAVILMPDVLHALAGLDIPSCVDQVLPFDALFDAHWQALSAQVLQAADDAARIAAFEAFLLPRWQSARRAHPALARSYRDWAEALATRAALSGLGRSVRQAERRIKAWAGLSWRELRGMGRAEQSYFSALKAIEAGSLSWAEVAAEAGYADQAHLCRDTRRVCGVAPEELKRRILTRESYWPYRTWE